MIEGEVIKVTAKSKKGRCRINEHGDEWMIVLLRDKDMLLQSIRDDYRRWMTLGEDKDFRLINEGTL